MTYVPYSYDDTYHSNAQQYSYSPNPYYPYPDGYSAPYPVPYPYLTYFPFVFPIFVDGFHDGFHPHMQNEKKPKK